MTISSMSALVAVAPGHLRDGLRAMLNTMPHVNIIEADDHDAAGALLAERRPDLVILDCDLPGGDANALVQQAKRESPSTRCAVLVNLPAERRAALAAGADSAPLKGMLASKLFVEVERLLFCNSPSTQ